MNWVETGSGYSLALDGGKLVCRNAKGKILSSVPKAVRESQVGEQLVELKGWLALHVAECKATVERWMLRSLPIPTATIVKVWPDPDWRAPLTNLLIRVDDDFGYLREAGDRGLGMVDMDGETFWRSPETLTIPHPILVANLDEHREAITDLQLTQQTVQLFRECWPLPQEDTRQVSTFSNGEFAQMVHAHGRARNLGYPVRGGYACCSVHQAGKVVEARYWIGSGTPDEPTETGELLWVDSKERPLSAFAAGPVAYSEGMRMASLIYAGRKVEKSETV